MVEVMIAVMPFHGHVAPMAAVTRAFLEAGHTVRVYTGAAHAGRFQALGARVVPWTSAPDFDENAERIGALLRDHDGPREVVEHTMALLGPKSDAV